MKKIKFISFKKDGPKILMYIFLTIFIIQIVILFFLLVTPNYASAQTNLQVSIGGQKQVKDITEYIPLIFDYSMGFVGILAAVVLMFGGVMWLTAGGNQGQVGEAKEWIKASLTGLILALLSFLILNTINPDLIKLEMPTIEKAKTGVEGRCGNTYCEDDEKCSGSKCVKEDEYWEKKCKTYDNAAMACYNIAGGDACKECGKRLNKNCTWKNNDCKSPLNGRCNENKDCVNGYCNTNIRKCQNPPQPISDGVNRGIKKEGDSCTNESECSYPLTCTNNKCAYVTD